MRRHVAYLATHPAQGFHSARVSGPANLAGYFADVEFNTALIAADIVHAHGLTAAARVLRRDRDYPVVVTVHTDIRTQGRTARWPPLRVIARALAARADAVIAVSERVRRSFPRARVIAPAFAPLPPPARSRDEVRASLETDPDRVVVVTAARLHRDKALDVFVRAVNASGAAGWICGDGPERERVASLARGTTVQLLGYRDDIADIFAAADVFALPAVGEAYGIAVVEALQAGLPVVATDAGAVREIVGDAGVIVQPGDDVAFGKAVRDVVADRARRGELAARARSIRIPSPDDLVKQIGDVYRSVCG